MPADILNMGLAFLEGLALIASPCILPILPIILSGSLAGSVKRPVGIIIGFIIVFALFTFFSRQLVLYTGIDLGLIRHISYGLLILFGIVMLSTYLTEKFNIFAQRLTSVGSNIAVLNDQEGGFLSGVLFGSLIAVIWTPCAGPILAAVIVQTVIQQTSIASFFTVLAFGLGAAIPMFLIALFGRRIMAKATFVKSHTTVIRKLLGAIIILAVFYMIYSESALGMSFSTTATSANHDANQLESELLDPYPAPEIAGITAWINSQPLTIESLKGKVVLIDFWTYSCINCVRTFPYIKNWYQKYHDKGLVIIGVHAPEFDFEKNLNNVEKAVMKNNIPYPVALDNQFITWRNYQNRYWPAHYLIDKKGNVVYQHFGEGEYDVTENNIRYLLGLGKSNLAKAADVTMQDQTPETYLGIARQDNYKSPEKVVEDVATLYSYPENLAKNEWAVKGHWIFQIDKIVSASANASLKIHFNAGKVYMVMGTKRNNPVDMKVLLDGNYFKTVTVDQHTLYEIVNFPQVKEGVLEFIAKDAGLEIYTFTFGS